MRLQILLQVLFLVAAIPAFSFDKRLYDPTFAEIQKNQELRLQKKKQEEEKRLQQFRIAKKDELNLFRHQTKLFLEELKTKTIYGVEILTAASSGNEVASVFGHSTIRLIVGDDPLEDIVIGPEAFVDDPTIDIPKAMAGGYTIIPRVMTFMDFLIQYHRGESRSLYRKIIPTTEQMRKNLIDAFLELNNNPISFGKDGYKFKTNNCASIVLKLLGRAKIINSTGDTGADKIEKLSLLSLIPVLRPYTALFGVFSADTPNMVVGYLQDQLYATTIPLSYVPAIDVFFDEMKKQGSWFLSKKSEKWSEKDIANLSKISTQALYMLHVGPIKMNRTLNQHVVSLLKQRNIDLYEIYKMISYDHKLYQICEDTTCAKEQFDIIKRTWNKKERFVNAGIWGGAPDRRYNLDEYFKFSDVAEGRITKYQVYNMYMQNLFEADLKN